MLNGVARRRFCEVPQTTLASTEIRSAASELICESRRCRLNFRGPIIVRSRRRMTLEGLIPNFFAGWSVGVGVDYTIKAAALR